MVEFPPHSIGVGEITDKMPGVSPRFKGKVYSYPEVIRCCLELGAGIGLPVYRGLMTGWDNTPAAAIASHIFHNATPEHYEVWLRRLIDHTRRHHEGDHRLIFVNAWNEWGEGAYLEPDQKYQVPPARSDRPRGFRRARARRAVRRAAPDTADSDEAQSLLTSSSTRFASTSRSSIWSRLADCFGPTVPATASGVASIRSSGAASRCRRSCWRTAQSASSTP